MKIMKIGFLFFLISLFSLPFSSSSYACSCFPPGTPFAELEKSDAVFSGKVINVKTDDSTLKAKISVKESWKGMDSKEVTVHTAIDSAGCGVNFETGKEYIIYSSLEDGKYITYLCSRTAELAYAQDDLTELGEGTVPSKSGDAAANSPSTQNLVVGSLGVVLILGGCFFYKWKSAK
ncbi:MAG: hypothetical protein ACQEV7_08750 [Bacillota bacterium]